MTTETLHPMVCTAKAYFGPSPLSQVCCELDPGHAGKHRNEQRLWDDKLPVVVWKCNNFHREGNVQIVARRSAMNHTELVVEWEATDALGNQYWSSSFTEAYRAKTDPVLDTERNAAALHAALRDHLGLSSHG